MTLYRRDTRVTVAGQAGSVLVEDTISRGGPHYRVQFDTGEVSAWVQHDEVDLWSPLDAPPDDWDDSQPLQ